MSIVLALVALIVLLAAARLALRTIDRHEKRAIARLTEERPDA